MSMEIKKHRRFSDEEKRAISLERAGELKKRISDYTEKKKTIKSGIELDEMIKSNKERMLAYFNAKEEDWVSWKWQMSHRIRDPKVLSKVLGIGDERLAGVEKVGLEYRWAVSPYYASLIRPNSLADPIMRQSVPRIEELDETGYDDPMSEEFTSPAPCITRRYPDRLIINVTNQCGMYCRHCQRRRNIGEIDKNQTEANLQAALEYIRKNTEIRDVLITGGDALLLSDKQLDWLLSELDKMDHVEIKRLGTRTPVTLPQRITPELCAVLKKHPPLFINTQFNHPREVTIESKKACDMLVEAGVVLGNQAVLLKGVNNDPHVMKKLNQELLRIRVRPYYIFHAKAVKGTKHFITTVDEGMEIMKKLRGFTSGLAVPTYIINAPHGYGKVPILPMYLQKHNGYWVRLKNWENREMEFSLVPESE